MGLAEPGEEAVVCAAAKELVNIMHHRGLSSDQSVQALIAASAATLSVVSMDDRELLDENLKMFCKQVRERSRILLGKPPGVRREES